MLPKTALKLVGAVVALALGPMIDRFGAQKMLLLTIAVVAVHAFLIASAGSKAYGLVAEQAGYVENYTILGVFVLAMLFATFFHRDPTTRAEIVDSG